MVVVVAASETFLLLFGLLHWRQDTQAGADQDRLEGSCSTVHPFPLRADDVWDFLSWGGCFPVRQAPLCHHCQDPGQDRDAVSWDTPDTEPLPEKMEGLSTC